MVQSSVKFFDYKVESVYFTGRPLSGIILVVKKLILCCIWIVFFNYYYFTFLLHATCTGILLVS